MSFSINTNVASLQAQNYLRVNSDFQSKTINRVTSGLRIVSSGDDAAGLAIANGYRSDEAVLTQGVRNANDGLSQLQIMDGGISNISMLLDRARTLATQSASGTFTGDRSVVNGEFQSVLGEIDRQAQSIGLDTGGIFAKNLAVFMGGGKANNGTSVIANGSVAVDLSKSTVDAKSLGLKGSPAMNSNTYSLDNNSSTSAAKVVAAAAGLPTAETKANFVFSGPGFSAGSNGTITVDVTLAGITDTNTLVQAINTRIGQLANGGTAADTAFKNAGVQAQIITDSNGNQKLAFTSPGTAFQVQAGNRTANAFLGNFATNSAAGAVMTSGVLGAGAYSTSGAAAENNITVSLTSAAGATQFQFNHVGGANIMTELGNTAAFTQAGYTLQANGGKIEIDRTDGNSFTIAVAGDLHNYAGFGAAIEGGAGTAASYTQITAGATIAAGSTTLVSGDIYAFNVSIGGGASTTLSVTAGNWDIRTQPGQISFVNAVNAAIATNQSLVDAGIQASVDGTFHLGFTSNNGTNFQLSVDTTDTNTVGVGAANSNLGFGTFGTGSFTSLSSKLPVALAPNFSSGSVQQSAMFGYSGMKYSPDTQAVTISATDANGNVQTTVVNLNYANDKTIDQAVADINTALQSNNNLLSGIVAEKVNNPNATPANSEAIMLQSATAPFTVSLGAGGHGNGMNLSGAQSVANNSTNAAGGNTIDIGTQTGAQNAVNALATAVSSLGSAQAVVGRGQNQFGYAINLAQSQLTNLTTAESRIRDADLASEAANLTKAQILLQAGVAALAQANSAPQSVLSLLKG